MDDCKKLGDILQNFEEIVKNPDKFVSVQDEKAKKTEGLIKKIYDFTKNTEDKIIQRPVKGQNTLPSLILGDFDPEQIWGQISLQNDDALDYIVSDVASLLAKQKLVFMTVKNKKDVVRNKSSKIVDSKDSYENVSNAKVKPSKSVSFKKKKSSIVDDKFFNLSEMEEWLNKIENGNENENDDSDDDSIDYFAEDLSLTENEETSLRGEDFFDPPDKEDSVQEHETNLEDEDEDDDEDDEDEDDEEDEEEGSISENDEIDETVSGEEAEHNGNRFSDEEEADEDNDLINEEEAEQDDNGLIDEEEAEQDDNDLIDEEEAEEDDEDDNDFSDEEDPKEQIKSSYEERQERLKARIAALEEKALQEKPWQMKGEVTGSKRPQNSLLEEYVEFDVATRPAPIITEKTTLKLEDVIRQRIKDKVWDDVVRKIKPVEDPKEYKKRLILNQEKSKLSLSEIYEKEYLKAKSGMEKEHKEVEEEEPSERIEIKKAMKILFSKLDALSNFHYTPRQAAPEVRITSHVPAVMTEEVAPVATSDATLLAPEEIKSKPKGDLIGKTERTTTDKKRERRKKILRQRSKRKEKEKQEKLVEKLQPGMGNKYSKEKAKTLLDKVSKEQNVSQMDQKYGKSIKSSDAFFSKLQDEVTSRIKRKTQDVIDVNKQKKFSAKKIKL